MAEKMRLTKKQVSDRAVDTACMWLLDQGYKVEKVNEVIDIVAEKDGEKDNIVVRVLKIVERDGFTYINNETSSRCQLPKEYKDLGVKLLLVAYDCVAWTKKELTRLLVQKGVIEPLNPEHYETV